MSEGVDLPVRVAVANDYELVVRGVAGLLHTDDRIDVVVLETGRPVDVDVDVVLFDTFGSGVSLEAKVADILASHRVQRILVYSSWYDRAAVETAMGAGASGFVAKSVAASDLADAIVQAHRGEVVLAGLQAIEAAGAGDDEDEAARVWPGKQFGLTEREANVLALIVQGLENTEVAERLFISVNTVKTRIRGLYRKIGADSRVQAALWAVKHGFDPDNTVIWLE